MLYRKIQPITYPFTITFADIVEVEIKLGYLAWTKAIYKRDFLNRLKSLTMSVRFLHICKWVVLAQLEPNLSENDLKNICVNIGTGVTLTWTPVRIDKLIRAKDITIYNKMDLQDDWVLVIYNNRYRKFWETGNLPMAIPITSAYKV